MAAAITNPDAVTVTTSATAIVPNSLISAANGGTTFEVYNADGSAAVNLGGSGVTTANGIPLGAGASKVMFLAPGQELYGIASSGTIEVRVMRIVS